jgi:hypothetical protein
MIMKTKVLIFSMFILLLVSCKQAEANAEDEPAAMMSISLPAKEMKADASDKEKYYAPPVKEEIEAKIIKSGDLRFQTDDLNKTYNQVQIAVKKYKASIKADSQFNEEERLTRRINIRIPNENFDAFITDISKGVSYFDLKRISSDDVTEEYIDVASRIKTKKVLEERYYDLLKKATKISEMLEIEKKLSEIREEIEAKEGRLKYIENKVSMSTLDIEFYKPLAQSQKATVSYGGRIGNAFVSGFNGISNFFIELLGIWPVIVTLVVLFILIRKRLKRKNKKDVIENQEH